MGGPSLTGSSQVKVSVRYVAAATLGWSGAAGGSPETSVTVMVTVASTVPPTGSEAVTVTVRDAWSS